MKPLIYDLAITDFTSAVSSPDIDASFMTQASVHAVITGDLSGMQIVLGATDQGADLVPLVQQFLGVSYVYSTLATLSITTAGNYFIPLTDICYNKLQLSIVLPVETVSVETVADVAGSLNNTYFFISIAPGDDSHADLYVWFNNGTGNNPDIPDRTSMQVNYTNGDSANSLAANIVSTINGVAPGAFASLTATNNVVTFVQNQVGPSGLADGTPPLDTGFTFNQSRVLTGTADIFLKTNNF